MMAVIWLSEEYYWGVPRLPIIQYLVCKTRKEHPENKVAKARSVKEKRGRNTPLITRRTKYCPEHMYVYIYIYWVEHGNFCWSRGRKQRSGGGVKFASLG